MANKTLSGSNYNSRSMNGLVEINADTITTNSISATDMTADFISANNLLEADVAETITANKWSFVYPPNLLNAPLDSNDAANKGYVDTAISTINLSAYQLTSTNTLANMLPRGTTAAGLGITNLGTTTIGTLSTQRTTIENTILTNKNYNGTTDDFIIMDNTTGINALIVAKYVKNTPVKIFGVDIGQNIITGYDASTFLPLRIVSLNGVKITINTYEWLFKTDGTLSFPDASIQSTAFIPANYYTSSYIDTTFLTTAIAAFTYQPVIDMVNYYTKIEADALFLSNPSLVDIVVNGLTIGKGNNSIVSNTALGVDCLKVISTGIENTMAGVKCGDALTSGSYNCGFGSGVLGTSTTGTGNTGFGRNALLFTGSVNYNTALGYTSGYYNVGSNNTYLGAYSGYFKSGGSNNVAIGYQSMYCGASNTSANNTSVGAFSLNSFQSSSIANTCVGYEALRLLTIGSNNSCLGNGSGYSFTTASRNSCVGVNTMQYKQQSNDCTAIGFGALAGVSPAIAGSTNNTGVGSFSLNLLTTGNFNTAVGAYSLYNTNIGYECTALGEGAGYRATSSSRCTYLGRNADNYTTIQFYNSTAVGYGATITASDSVFLGQGNTCIVYAGAGIRCKAGVNATTYGNVFNINWTGSAWEVWIDSTRVYNSSDYRLKENFTEPKPVLDRLCGVKMIEYEYKDIGIFKKGGRMLGVLAHELGEAFPELDSVVLGKKDELNENGEIQPQGIHEKHTMLFMKAIQELNAKVEAQQKQIELLLSIIKSNGLV